MRRATHKRVEPGAHRQEQRIAELRRRRREMRFGCNQQWRTRGTRQRQFGHLAADDVISRPLAALDNPLLDQHMHDAMYRRAGERGRLHDLSQRYASFPANRERPQHRHRAADRLPALPRPSPARP